MRRKAGIVFIGILLGSGLAIAARRMAPIFHVGKQPDGAFIVATGQRIEPGAIAFDGRPIDLAMHPSGAFVAVLNQRNVFLADKNGIIEGSKTSLASGAAFRGALWSPDGARLFVSVADGYVQELTLENRTLLLARRLAVMPPNAKGNPRPGGMAITRDGKRLFVAAANRDAIAEIDLTTNQWVKEYPVQNLPFEVQLSPDEKTLIASNWGGRPAKDGDLTAPSDNLMIVVDPRGVCATGTVSLIRRDTGQTQHVAVGLHPTGIAIQGNLAYVANAASDTISVVDVAHAKLLKTIPIKWGKLNIFGSMPGALALRDGTLYACNGGDNAVCEIDTASGRVRGFRSAGFFPTGIVLAPDGRTAFVVNTKGNGSVRNTVLGREGNAHDFQGAVTVIDLTADLNQATARVAADDGWNRDRSSLHPNLAVYRGAIQHVLYIIKENRTYDQVLGDLPQGNGKASLAAFGAKVTPNAHALATEFALFDNAYVNGTNSAEGHQWTDEALANDYIERFYAGYRTYPDDGDCAMTMSTGGFLWTQAAKKGKTIRDYGEFGDSDRTRFIPQPRDWLDMWKDRVAGTHRIETQVITPVRSLRPYLNPHYCYWPLLQSDQARADIFIAEYEKYSKEDKVPNLMMMSLPSDHTEGLDPKYPKPRSMVADNDLALGRIVEAVSHSPQWKDTCIFVIEDDAQSGDDHVDGHRTVCLALSPYIRRHCVDSSFYTQVSIVRSIELMLGLDPMTKFDALAVPFAACFTDTPNLAPFSHVDNLVRLDDMNYSSKRLQGKARYWSEQSAKLDWSGMDRANPEILDRVIWHSVYGFDRPYPQGDALPPQAAAKRSDDD